MRLDDWLNVEKKTSAEFARLSGIGDRQTVHKYRRGERFPTPENLQRIRKATGGAVTANDFADQHAPEDSLEERATKRLPAAKDIASRPSKAVAPKRMRAVAAANAAPSKTAAPPATAKPIPSPRHKAA